MVHSTLARSSVTTHTLAATGTFLFLACALLAVPSARAQQVSLRSADAGSGELSAEARTRISATVAARRSMKADVLAGAAPVSALLLERARTAASKGAATELDVEVLTSGLTPDRLEALGRLGAVIDAGAANGRVRMALPASALNAAGDLPFVTRIRAYVQAPSGVLADVTYSSAYVDTEPGDAYSFPEDAHDFCRATPFGFDGLQDYYLDASLGEGSLTVSLAWTSGGADVTDYDVYLFDGEGRTVGDPMGAFPNGENGDGTQTAADSLVEVATVSHTGAAAPLYVVIDRFRGTPGGTLTLTLTGDDGTFEVLEYVGEGGFFYVDAVTDEVIGPLTDGLTINLDQLPSPPPNFNIVYGTPGCAQSVAFILDGEAADTSTVDNGDPFSLFGDTDGDLNPGTLDEGTYTLIVTPYSGTDGTGIPAAADTVTFSITRTDVPTGPYIAHYTLINAATEQPIAGWDPIPEGATLDMATLPLQLNIRANLVDPDTLIESVRLFLTLDGANAFISPTGHRTEKARPYSVFSDFSQPIQGDDTTIDVDPPNVSNYANWSVTKNAVRRDGVYQLLGIPYNVDAPNSPDAIAYGPNTLNFTVVNAPPETAGRLAADNAALSPNFPNPFNPSTTIVFTLQEDSDVRLAVYDLLGRQVQLLMDAPLSEGVYEVRFDADELPSGTYFYRLQTPGSTLVRRMTLLK